QTRNQMQQNAVNARVAKQLAQVDFEGGVALNFMMAPTIFFGGARAVVGGAFVRTAEVGAARRAAVMYSGIPLQAAFADKRAVAGGVALAAGAIAWEMTGAPNGPTILSTPGDVINTSP